MQRTYHHGSDAVGQSVGKRMVQIPAATDLSRKKGRDSSTVKRSAIGVSVAVLRDDHYKLMSVPQKVWHGKKPHWP